ncbi:MAG: hypothetical protein J6Y66_06145 [Bacteroidales bacterium]|nr:hypothetical protein [Bacteroidales bacterium]
MRRIVSRVMPDGEIKNVQPFHVIIKGLETAILCRDSDDYDVFVKYIAICARRKNVIVVIYTVVSNHCHAAVLALSQKDADDFANDLKKMYSQWFSAKYGEPKVLRGVDSRALCLDNEWYVRNTLAYIPRNALDNGCPVQDYEWTGFSAMFSGDTASCGIRVSSLTKREVSAIMHTRDKLKDVSWQLDARGHLIPGSFCDTEYLEQAFNHDQAFFLKTLGSVNPAEMEEKLVEAPRRLLPDSEFFKVVSDTSLRWYKQDVSTLPPEKKLRMLSYVWRSHKTTVPQLARAFGLDRDRVRSALNLKGTEAP